MSGCVVWVGAMNRKGYGYVRIGGITKYAHRVAFTEAYGPVPSGMFVCHSCDNPSCINSEHLFLGTPMDNVNDAVIKNRFARCKVHDNWYIEKDGKRHCRSCRTLYMKLLRAKKQHSPEEETL